MKQKKQIHVIFTKGLQASGKSTWAENFIKLNQKYKRINRDSFRTMLSNYTFDNENEKLVTSLCNKAICDLIEKGYNIIIDQMNLNQERLLEDIAYINKICESNNKELKYEIMEFPIHLGEALIRDRARIHPIGDNIIKKTWKRYEIDLRQMLDRHKVFYPWDHNLPYCGISDLDGTLSHSPHRRIYSREGILEDQIHFPVWSILDKYKGKIDIIILSGRSEDFRSETEEWLKTQAVNYQALYMRKSKDNRDDRIVKLELFDEHIRGKYQPMFVIDDRPKILELWQSMGLFTINVNQDVYAKNDF